MATQFNHDCPHCATKSAGFQVACQWPSRVASNRANLLAICGVCDLGITLVADNPDSGTFPSLLQQSLTFPGSSYRIVRVWPRASLEVPAGTPENISSFYSQALRGLSSEHWDAAGAMFRKTLDVATKLIAPDKKSDTLYARINALVADGRLTEAMGDWSHEIRLDGNEAVHGDEPETDDDATTLQKFTEAFLTYSFTLPALVAANRAKRAPANDAATGRAA